MLRAFFRAAPKSRALLAVYVVGLCFGEMYTTAACTRAGFFPNEPSPDAAAGDAGRDIVVDSRATDMLSDSGDAASDGSIPDMEPDIQADAAPPDGSPSTVRLSRTRGVGPASIKFVRTDTSGNLIIAGEFQSNIDILDQQLVLTGTQNVFIAKISIDGDLLWARATVGLGRQTVDGLATLNSGRIAIAGTFSTNLIYQSVNMIASDGSEDGYLLFLNEDSGLNAAHPISSTGTLAINGLDASADSQVVFGGTHLGTLMVGGQSLSTMGSDGHGILRHL